MEKNRIERVLILAKTYPSPSAQYFETSCVAGINEHGVMRRLYPVPFRMIEQGQQFKKWQWISVRVEKANKDHRPESHKIYVNTISCQEEIKTTNKWLKRWPWLDKMPTFGSIDAIDQARLNDGLTKFLLDGAHCQRPETVASHFVAIAHALQCHQDGAIRHGFLMVALVRKKIFVSTGQRVQIAQ